jgi:hypothetical protein
MRAQLHKAFRLSGNELLDTQLSGVHSLTPDTSWLIRAMRREGQISKLITNTAAERGLSEASAQRAVYTLLSKLGKLGALQVDARDIPGGLFSRLWFTLPLRQRYAATVRGFVSAVWRSYGLLCVLMMLPFVVLRLYIGAQPGVNIWPFMAMPLLLFFTFVMHEGAHLLAAKYLGVKAALLSGFGYIAVVHARSGLRHMRIIAAAGPIGAGLPVILVGLLVPHVYMQFMLIIIGLVHLMHILPTSADGRAIWKRSQS